MLWIVIVALMCCDGKIEAQFKIDTEEYCQPTETTVSGVYAPTGTLCRGQLIFSEEFDDVLDTNLWTHEQRLSPVNLFESFFVNYFVNNIVMSQTRTASSNGT